MSYMSPSDDRISVRISSELRAEIKAKLQAENADRKPEERLTESRFITSCIRLGLMEYGMKWGQLTGLPPNSIETDA